MASKILFRIDSDTQRAMGFGNAGNLFQISYFKGKELGYKDGEIYFEWPLRVTYKNNRFIYVPCPKNGYLPIKFINRMDVNKDDYEQIIDFLEPDVLYAGYEPLYEMKKPPFGKINWASHMSYLNIYYENTGERPEFNIPLDKLDMQYILFHYRLITEYGDYRNPNPDIVYTILKLLKNRYGNKYKYFKTGEAFELLDEKFDFIAPYYVETDVNDFFRLINNATFIVGVNSGIACFGEIFGKPLVEMEQSYIIPKTNEYGQRSEDYWKSRNGYGITYYDWRDPEKYQIYFKGYPINTINFMNFVHKWLK